MVPWPNLRRQMRLVHTARVLVFIGGRGQSECGGAAGLGRVMLYGGLAH
jgi:hypothetical protein